MRRSEKEITERSAIDEIINRCLVCRLALSDGGIPYVIPMNFGYEGNTLYFHTAREGRKLDILRKNNQVCFELDTDVEIIAAEDAAGWGARYCCVIGFGTASLVDDPVEKRKAYDSIMPVAGRQEATSVAITQAGLSAIRICASTVRSLSGSTLIPSPARGQDSDSPGRPLSQDCDRQRMSGGRC